MKVCSSIEELVCVSCIYSEASEDENFSLCNLKNETMGELTRDDSFCGEGSWALKAITENYHYDKEGNRTKDTSTTRIKVLEREDAISTFLNDGILEW